MADTSKQIAPKLLDLLLECIAETIVTRPVLGHWPAMQAHIDSAAVLQARAEIERLRSALEGMVSAADAHEFDYWHGSGALLALGRARAALYGAVPAGETDTSRVAQIRKAPYPESARSQGGGRAHSQGEAAGSTPASGLPVEAKTAVGSGPCQHPFRTHWTGGGKKGVTCATCGAELARSTYWELRGGEGVCTVCTPVETTGGRK